MKTFEKLFLAVEDWSITKNSEMYNTYILLYIIIVVQQNCNRFITLLKI